MNRSLLAVFAHPDDESIVAGGTLLRYAKEGVHTALICATRGEWGTIGDHDLEDCSNPGEIRERELRGACHILSINRLEFLDLDDGGVRAIIGDEEEAVVLEKIVRAIRSFRPQVVITFGPDGLYGHDDHIAIGYLTTKACALAGEAQSFPHHSVEGIEPHQISKLYYSTWPQELAKALLEKLGKIGRPAHLWNFSPDQFGVPAEKITTTIDVSKYVSDKLAALRCHRSQINANHAFKVITPEIAREFLGAEYFQIAFPDKELTAPETGLF